MAIDADKVVQQAKSQFPKIDLDLDANLASSRHAFEQLKYAHEGMPNSFLIGNLPVALHRALVSLHPEWDEPVSAVPVPLASFPSDTSSDFGRTEGAAKMKSFEEFEGRVDDLLTQVAGPAADMEMLVRAKGAGVFNDHYDDPSRWTRANPQDFAEQQARDVAGHIVRQSQRDAEFVRTALARLGIP